MKKLIGLLLILPVLALAKSGLNSQWVCSATEEASGEHWTAEAKHQRRALNKAFERCRDQAKKPASCKVAKEWCRYQSATHAGFQRWRCSAFDDAGGNWYGDYHGSRSEAIMGALEVCKQFSISPNTCHIRLITCNHLGQT